MNEATQLSEKACMPSREKYWEECDAEQKLDRLRDAVARICRDMNVLTAGIQRLAAHSHGEKGDLLIPMHFVDPAANASSGMLGGGLYAHDHGIPHNLRTARERR